MASFFHVLEQLLISSCRTLKSTITIGTSFPPTCPPLVIVTELNVGTGTNENLVLNVLRSINYPRLLPALSHVSLTFFEWRVPNKILGNTSNNALHPSASDRSVNLSVHLMIALQDLSQIFPNVNVVHHFCHSNQPHVDVMPYEELCAYWNHLGAIFVVGENLSGNFDAEFLGINSEEVDVLREQDESSLERMHIVPVRPSILTKSRKPKPTLIFGE